MKDIIFSFLPFSKEDTGVILMYATDINFVAYSVANICSIPEYDSCIFL